MTILPLAYLPSVSYFTCLLHDECVVDLGEHFVKRSERNRARILATGGVMELTAHVCHANRPRQPMRTVRPRLLETLAAPALGGAGRLLPFVALFRTLCLPFSNPSTAWEYGFLVDYDLELLETHLHAGPDSVSASLRDLRRGPAGRSGHEVPIREGPGFCCRVLFPGLFRQDAFCA